MLPCIEWNNSDSQTSLKRALFFLRSYVFDTIKYEIEIDLYEESVFIREPDRRHRDGAVMLSLHKLGQAGR